MSTKKELLAYSIEHYERMIKWCVKREIREKECLTFNSLPYLVSSLMHDEINESWSGDACPLCKAFFRAEEGAQGVCGECPIRVDRHPFCLNTPWIRINSSKTKSELLKALRDEQAYLRRLYFKERA